MTGVGILGENVLTDPHGDMFQFLSDGMRIYRRNNQIMRWNSLGVIA